MLVVARVYTDLGCFIFVNYVMHQLQYSHTLTDLR